MKQQPQDKPYTPHIEATTDLEAEMEKTRILRAAMASNDRVIKRHMQRSRELSRLQANVDY